MGCILKFLLYSFLAVFTLAQCTRFKPEPLEPLIKKTACWNLDGIRNPRLDDFGILSEESLAALAKIYTVDLKGLDLSNKDIDAEVSNFFNMLNDKQASDLANDKTISLTVKQEEQIKDKQTQKILAEKLCLKKYT